MDRKKPLFAVIMVWTLAAMVSNPLPAKGQKAVVTWFLTSTTANTQQQRTVEEAIVEKFNKQQSKIELKLNIMYSNHILEEDLRQMIAEDNAPDILGPDDSFVMNYFHDQWLDLSSLVLKHNYDLAQFPKPLVDLYREDGRLTAIPFAVFPGLLYYNVKLFDVAGLEYPPSKFGEQYRLDGKLVDWNWNTVAEIGKRLTIDSNGNSANEPLFDPSKIVQFGFANPWDTMRSDFSTFGGASVVNEQGKAVIPDHWREEARWLWNGIWKDHFIPSAAYWNSDIFTPQAFAFGKVAMARSMLWYTCCLADMKDKWDLAVMPAYKGKVYAPADVYTFFVHKDTKNPDAAFEVLTYLLGNAAPELLKTYEEYPARLDLQNQLLSLFSNKYPDVKNWHVVAPSVDYVVVPHQESNYSNFSKGQSRFNDFYMLLYGDQGKNIDLDKELDKLEADLQVIVDKPPTPES